MDEVRICIDVLSPEAVARLFNGHADIAGRLVRIHHNTVRVMDNDYSIVGIRGVPAEGCWIHHNWFSLPSATESIIQRHAFSNMHVHQNWNGAPTTLISGWEGSD
ncbi:hypothetical protein ACFL6C_11140 [Myxococcota bacterium]